MGPNKQQHNKKNMLRYDRQPKSGLVALHDIRPANGVGLFLQPRSPHRAYQ